MTYPTRFRNLILFHIKLKFSFRVYGIIIQTNNLVFLFFVYNKVCIIPTMYTSRASSILLKTRRGLPWWRSGWESACQCRAHGFELWSGKIPHAAERLGPWATIAEPAHLEPVLRNKRGRDGERPAHRDEEWPPLATTRESPRTGTKTQHSHK